MKILFTTMDRGGRVCIDMIDRFEKTFGKIAECKWAGIGHPLYNRGENVNEIVERVMPDVDWVISIADGRPPNLGKEKRDYKVAMITSDLHGNYKLNLNMIGFLNYLNGLNVDAFLMYYTQIAHPGGKSRPKEFNPKIFLNKLKAPILHLATSIDPEYFKPIKGPKNYDVVFLGAHGSKHYPFRKLIWKGLKPLAQKHAWRILMKDRPPGSSPRRKIDRYMKKGYIVGEKYVKTLAKSKCFIFGVSRYKYPVLRFAEGMACGTCILSDPPLTAKKLHFIPDWNFVKITPENWRRKLVYYVNHNKEREEIARNGYNTVMKYHTNDIRANQLLAFLEEHR